MKQYIRLFLWVCGLVWAVFNIPGVLAGSSGVLISEVAFNPVGTDTGKEYVELYNNADYEINISGWDLDADMLPYFTFSEGTVIQAKSIMTVYLRKEGLSGSGVIFTGTTFGSANMRSSKGMVALFNNTVHDSSTIVDYVEYGMYGEVHESLAVQVKLWLQNMYFSFIDMEGYSIQRVCSGHTVECFTLDVETPAYSLLSTVVESVGSEHTVLINGEPYGGSTFTTYDPVSFSIVAATGSLLSVMLDGEMLHNDLESSFHWIPVDEGTYNFSYQLGEAQHTFTYILEATIIFTDPTIRITEVLFHANEGQSDFVELWIENAGSMTGQYLEGYGLVIDSVTYDLSTVRGVSDSYILLVLGTVVPEVPVGTSVIHDSSSPGLVSTTEQIYVRNVANMLLDGVCWEGTTIPSNERQEHTWFTQASGIWTGSCISSTAISKGSSIQRVFDEDAEYSKDSFLILPITTPGLRDVNSIESTVPVITVQGGGLTSGKAPFGVNVTAESSVSPLTISGYYWDYGDGYRYEGKNPPNHVYTSPGVYSLTLELVDQLGRRVSSMVEIRVTIPDTVTSTVEEPSPRCTSEKDMFSYIRINEIYPNPVGTDDGKEWIELFNTADTSVSLCNLFLDDQAGGSSPYNLSAITMQSKELLVLSSARTKLSLGNTSDSVRLLLLDAVLQEVLYTQAPEGKSYSVFYNKNLL